MMNLENRVYAIAGAGGGLGPVVARRLAEAGATLALGDANVDRLNLVASQLEIPSDRCDVRVVDMLSEDDCRDWDAHLEDRFGRTDGLIHLVGGWRGGQPLAEFPLADYNFLHDLLVRTVIHSTRAFYEAMIESRHGRFIIVSAAQAQNPDGTNAAYATTKAAAEAWTLALADSFRAAESEATANILVVNAILTEQMRAENPDKPYRTFTSTEEIAAAIEFLCSDAGQKMNGKRLPLHPLR